MPRRSYSEDLQYIRRVADTKFEIMKGFVPNMLVPGYFYVNAALEPLMFEELQASSEGDGVGGFLPAVSQIANVASLPGIVGASVGLPDTHSGYGFAIGNVAAFDMDDPQAVVSPGGVGFDINCVCEGELVNLSDGSSLPIQDVQAGAAVLSMDGTRGLVPRLVTAPLPRGESDCIELMFLDGRTVTVTSDHRLLRADGDWVTADGLQVAEAVAAGVEYPHIDRGEDGGGWELDLTASLGFRLNMLDRRQQAVAFTRILGYCVSAGAVADSHGSIKGKISLQHELDVESMRADVRLLTTEQATVEMEGDTFALCLPAGLTAAFVSVGVDVKARVDSLFHLPAFICAAGCPSPLVRAFVSGYFGGDGHTVTLRHLSDGGCVMGTIGFSLRRTAAIAAAQLALLQLELGGLFLCCGIAESDCSWFIDADAGRAEAQRRKTVGAAPGRRLNVEDADAMSAEHRVQIRLELSREATIAFAQSCGFAHCCHKQLRLSAGVTVLRALSLLSSQRKALIAAVDAMETGTLTEKLARAKKALSETEPLHPHVGAWTPQRRADVYDSSCAEAGSTVSDVLTAIDAHALFGERRSEPSCCSKKRKAGLTKSAGAEERVGDEDKENRGSAGGEKKSCRVAYTVPPGRTSLPVFRLPLVAKRAVGRKRVFDLVIDPETPSFTANGVVVHNCGVRLIRTSLQLQDVLPVQEKLTQALFDHIPVGVGSKGVIPTRQSDLLDALQLGIDWSVREGYAWVEDKEHIEEYGRMLDADVGAVSGRARQRGLPQLGTLGAGNHYCLVPGTGVALASGVQMPIERVEVGDRVLVWDAQARRVSTASVTARVSPRVVQTVTELTLEDGRTLRCTDDHKVVRRVPKDEEKGEGECRDIPAGQLKVGDEVAVSLEGVSAAADAPSTWRLEYAGEAAAGYSFAFQTPEEMARTLAFARILGYSQGDASFHRTQTTCGVYIGSLLDAAALRADIALVTGTEAPAVHDTQSTRLYRGVESVVRVYVVYLPASLVRTILALPGQSRGQRSSQKKSWPSCVLSPACPAGVVREFLAGLCGADGHTAFVMRRRGRQQAYIFRHEKALSQSSQHGQSEALKRKMQRLIPLFARVGVTVVLSDKAERAGAVHKRFRNTVFLLFRSSGAVDFVARVGYRYCHDKALKAAVAAMHVKTRLYLEHNLEQLHVLAADNYEGAKAQLTRTLSGPQTRALIHECIAAAERTPYEERERERLVPALASISSRQMADRRNHLKKYAGKKRANRETHAVALPPDGCEGALAFLARVGADRWFSVAEEEDEDDEEGEEDVENLPPQPPSRTARTQAFAPAAHSGVTSGEQSEEKKAVIRKRQYVGAREDVTLPPVFLRVSRVRTVQLEQPTPVWDLQINNATPYFLAGGVCVHNCEVQVVEEVFDEYAARCMGIEQVGQVCVMIHSGSRGLGHQVATDALVDMEAAMARQRLKLNDRQLACARINSAEGSKYLKAMAAAANYAFVNRSAMTFLVRQAFASVFQQSADDLDMRLVYDVSHNIAKQETHWHDGRERRLLVHRKGATRAFPAHHPLVPVDYQLCGQPVLIGGSMGTCSYVLTGTELGMKETWGSTCHGAGRAMSRNRSRRQLGWEEVHARLRDSGISIRMASPKLVTEEAPESYKDVTEVVNTCHQAGISKKTVKLRPIAVVKG